MNLCYELLDESFEIKYGEYCNITIENVLEFRRVLESLDTQDVIKIYDEDNLIRNYHIIPNISFLDFSDKRIINKVYNDLLSYVKQDGFYKESIELTSNIHNYVRNLIFEYSFPLTINEELDFGYLFKSVGVQLELDCESYLERFITYLEIYQKIFNINVFFTVDLSNSLLEKEMIELQNHIEINNILIINLDMFCLKSKNIYKHILLDQDLCRII